MYMKDSTRTISDEDKRRSTPTLPSRDKRRLSKRKFFGKLKKIALKLVEFIPCLCLRNSRKIAPFDFMTSNKNVRGR